MNRRLWAKAKRLLPAPVVRFTQRSLRTDGGRLYEFKQEFFWRVFKALEFNHITGDYLEFGSFGATTFRLAYDQAHRRKVPRHLWAFDSFEGLPQAASALDNHPKWNQGSLRMDLPAFHRTCRAHGMKEKDYTTIQGYYEDTLTKLGPTDAPTDVALVYIDCDMYSSTKTVLDFLTPRLKHGMVIAFDDYFCWSADQLSGERRAMLEWMATNPRWHFLRYMDFGWASTSFIVERADLVNGAPDAEADKR